MNVTESTTKNATASKEAASKATKYPFPPMPLKRMPLTENQKLKAKKVETTQTVKNSVSYASAADY